jgi:patatin-like phospholipase/acyl hydrolase
MAGLMRILSIDGGGIRGLIPARVLVEVEKLLREHSGVHDARISDYFDLIAGTSTGGILCCLYLCPDRSGNGRPRFRAEDAVELYLDRGDEIFSIPTWHRIRSANGIRDEKYPSGGIEEALEDSLGDLELKDLLGPCLVTAYDIKRRKAHFFTQHRAAANEGRNFYVRDVARATSAAPTYFEVARVKSRLGVSYPLADGGVFANNPTLCAYAEARSRLGSKGAEGMAVLSLGTGSSLKPYLYQDAKDWGLLEWAKPILDIMMSGVSDTVDYQLAQIFDSVGKQSQYLRVQADLGREGEGVGALDNVEPENLSKLVAIGAELTADEKVRPRLEAFVQLLVKEGRRGEGNGG